MRKVTLVLGTGNRGKIAEFGRLLNGPWRLSDLSQMPGWEPVDEDGRTLADNWRRKARAAACQLKQWVLADDTGLEVDAAWRRSGGPFRPLCRSGCHSRGKPKPIAAATQRHRHRRPDCELRVPCGAADPDGQIRVESTGRCRGRIRTSAAGCGGFGYDSLFEIVEYHLTLAELGTAASDCLTHRARAVEAIRPRLRELLVIGD